MTTKRKILLIISILIAVTAIISAVILGLSMRRTRLIRESIALGNKYYATGNYESAVVHFERALELDPTEEEPYYGLVRIYSDKGFTEKLNELIDKARRYGIIFSVGEENTEDNVPGTSSGEIVTINNSLLAEIAESSYKDYRDNIGIVSEEMDSYGSISVQLINHSGEYIFKNSNQRENSIVDGKINDNSYPTDIYVHDLKTVFGKDSLRYEELQQLGLNQLRVLNGVLSFRSNGCILYLKCDQEGNVEEGTVCHIVPEKSLIAEESELQTLKGSITDATTGKGVSNALITIRERGKRSGEAIKSSKTDSAGWYDASLESGEYTVEIRRDGYATEFFDVTVGDYDNETRENFVISPELEAGEIRFVLEWGAYPRDLDSYLRGTASDGYSVFVCYYRKECSNGQKKYAELDIDKTSGYGPETITVYDTTGNYELTIADYNVTGSLGSSNATIKVYMPGREVVTIRIADASNTSTSNKSAWIVGRIQNGELYIDNRVEDVTYTSGRK